MKSPVAPPVFPVVPLRLGSCLATLVAVGLAAVWPAGPARAQTITLATSGPLDLGLAANWSSDTIPTTTNILEWDPTVTSAESYTSSAVLSVAGLQLTSPAGGITIAGTNLLTIGASGIDLSAATQSLTISDLIALGASQTWTVAAGQSLAVTNVDTITGSNTNLTIAGAGNVNLVSGFSAGTGSLALNGTGTVTLSGANTFTGGTTITGGTVVVNNANAFGPTPQTGDPAVVINGGTLTVGSLNLGYDFSGTGGQISVAPGANTILGSVGDLGGFNYGGTLVIGAGTALELASAGPATIGNLIVSTGTLSSGSSFPVILPVGGTLTASGTFNISAAFTASQTETASSGSPTFSSATIQGPTGASTLTFAGALNGGGTLLGNIAIANTYNPDSGHGAQVTANGNIGLGANAITTLNIGGLVPGEYDQTLIKGGTYTLNGTLVLTFNAVTSSGGIFSATGGQFSPTAGSSFTLFSATTGATLAGSFSAFNLGGLSSNLLAWDTSTLNSSGGGVITVDLANYYWTGNATSLTTSWANSLGLTNKGNFVNTFSSATSVSTGLLSISNVFLANSGARNVTTQSMGANFLINSLSFIAGGITLNGGKTTTVDTLTLSAGNSFQDQTAKNYVAGTGLVMQSGAAASTISTTVKVGLQNSQIWENDSTNLLTVAGQITDGGSKFSLTKTGSGTILFTSTSNSYTGGTNVAAGTLKMGATTAVLGDKIGSGTLTVSGGNFDLGGSTQSVSGINISSGLIMNSGAGGFITLSGSSGVVDSGAGTATISAILNGTAGLTENGTGTLVLTSTVSTFSGGTTVAGGTLKMGSATALLGNAIGSGTLTVSGGTFDLNGSTQSVSGVNLSSGIIMNGGSGGGIALTGSNGLVDSGAGTATLAAVLSGTAGLTKSGAGALQVLVAELYSGTTNISQGLLELSAPGSLASGSTVTISGTGTLGGNGSAGPTTVAAGGSLAPGSGVSGAGRLTLASATLLPGSSLALNLNSAGGGTAGTNYSQLAVTGTLNLGSLTTANPVTVNLAPVSANLLDGAVSYTWTNVINTGSSLVGSFNAADFSINSSAFAPSGTLGSFALSVDSNTTGIDLTYVSVIPEPSVVALYSGLAALGFVAIRRRRS